MNGLTIRDFREVGEIAGSKRGRAEAIHGEVREAVARWSEFAHETKVDEDTTDRMGDAHQLDLPPR